MDKASTFAEMVESVFGSDGLKVPDATRSLTTLLTQMTYSSKWHGN